MLQQNTKSKICLGHGLSSVKEDPNLNLNLNLKL